MTDHAQRFGGLRLRDDSVEIERRQITWACFEADKWVFREPEQTDWVYEYLVHLERGYPGWKWDSGVQQTDLAEFNSEDTA